MSNVNHGADKLFYRRFYSNSSMSEKNRCVDAFWSYLSDQNPELADRITSVIDEKGFLMKKYFFQCLEENVLDLGYKSFSADRDDILLISSLESAINKYSRAFISQD